MIREKHKQKCKARVPKRRTGTDQLVRAMIAGNAAGAKELD
jgi:hypothetical protein